MTMPSLIAKHRALVLKNQFAKAYSIVQQQVLSARQEFGIENFQRYCVSYDGANNVFTNNEECKEILKNQVKIVGSCNYKTAPKTYSKSANAYMDIGATAKPKYLLSDGTCYQANINASRLGITVDINGPSKGPNAVGHDIFNFWIDSNDKVTGPKATGYSNDDTLQSELDACGKPSDALTQSSACLASAQQRGMPCSRASKQQGNGLGCTWFAINDTCPDDQTKKYWECLP